MFFSKKSTLLILVSGVVCATILVGIGYLVGRSLTIRKEKAFYQNVLAQKQTECSESVKNIGEKLWYCVNDMAHMVSDERLPYSQQFGMFSPLFEGKEYTSYVYEYKQATVKGQKLELPEGVTVTVWNLADGGFSRRLEKYKTTDFATFGGYENHGTPVYLSELMANWNEKDTYTSKSGDTYYYQYDRDRGGIYAVSLHFYSTYSAISAIYVTVTAPLVLEQGSVSTLQDPAVPKAKAVVQKVVDTMSLGF